MKGFLKIKHILLTVLFGVLLSNPSFDSDGDGQFDGLPSFNFDASVTGVIGDGSIGVVGQDYLVAHVDDEIRGVGIASEIPFGPYAGQIAYLTTYGSYEGGSADSPGETISFYFYNGATEDTTPITETINFISDGSDGSVTAPFEFTLGSSYPAPPECVDNDAAVTPFDCVAAVASFGCGFTWGVSLISEVCPVSCDSCPEYELGCMDPSALNYDENAEYHDGDTCTYCGDDDSAVTPFDCATAVATFGCDFTWGNSLISDVCVSSCNPEECAECEDVDSDDICDDEDDCIGDYDECGVCNGDGIDEDACDCDGNVDLGCGCGEPAATTWCQDLDGDGLGGGTAVEGCSAPPGWINDCSDPEPDCATNDTDECGECGGDGIDEGACDCEGNILDECGECGGTGIPGWACDCDGNVLDCAGECGGDAVVDECGECNGDGIDEGACDCDGNVLDCMGECGGSAVEDICGDCNGDGINPGECDCEGNVLDCAGECGGTAIVDECGVCEGPGAVYDCGCSDMPDGACDCNGNMLDECGECGGNGPEENYDCDGNCTVEIDCLGVCGGDAVIDACGLCDGPGEIYECGCADIADGECDCNGNVLDECGECGGSGTDECNLCDGDIVDCQDLPANTIYLNSDGTVWYNSNEDIYGIQIDVYGVEVTDAINIENNFTYYFTLSKS